MHGSQDNKYLGTEVPMSVLSDKRKSLRTSLVVLRVTATERGKTFFGYADNISRSGMFIGTENPRNPGSRFLVEITFPKPIAKTVRCSCEVVWKRIHNPESDHKAGMGIRFLDLPKDVAKAINTWVEETSGIRM